MKSLYRIRPRKNLGNYYVFDVETQGLSARPEAFLFCCMVGNGYRRTFRSIDAFKREIAKKKFKGSTIFAHNAEYDLTVIFDHIIKGLDNKAIFNGKFITAQKDGVRFADSFNIFPTSVKKIGDLIGLPKLELDEGFKKGNKKTITDEDIIYCYRDCDIIYKALQAIFMECGSLKITIASLAMAKFRNTYIKSVIKTDDKYIYSFFDSYYGGRVEAFKLGKVNGIKYDFNSMYPYAMRNCVFPNPLYLKEVKNVHRNYFDYILKNYEGLATLTVLHSKTHIGYLPYKYSDKLVFPNGKIKGSWNFNELRFALEEKVIEIETIHTVIYSYPYASPFIEFVDDIYAKRIASKGIMKEIYKLILNSLYGKFAQRIKEKQVYYPEIPYDRIDALMAKGKHFSLQMFSKKRNDCFLATEEDKKLLHTIPLFSSYITSYARVMLLKSMLKHEKDLVYVDTDSLCLQDSPNLYDEKFLGGLKQESAIITEIYGNKSYVENDKGTEKLKMKGVPAKAKRVIHNIFSYEHLLKTKSALRRNVDPGVLSEAHKVLKFIYDKRIVHKDGSTECINFK